MTTRFTSHLQHVLTELDRTLNARLDAAAIHLTNEVKVVLSEPGTERAASGFTGTGTIGTLGRRYRAGRRIYGARRSLPGHPPLKQKGHLRRSYTWERAGYSRRVGTNYKVAKWLELGTKKMAARPHLRVTAFAQMGTLRRIIERGELPGAGGP